MPIRLPPGLHWLLCTLVVGGAVGTASPGRGQERIPPRTKVADKRMLIGYNEYRTDLKTGDACDQSTLSCVVNADGTGRRVLAHGLKKDEYTAVPFQGWTPDGKSAKLLALRTSPEVTKRDEKQQTYTQGRLPPQEYLFDLATGKTALEPPPSVPKSRYTIGGHGYKVSPDGKLICFANGGLGVANLDGSKARTIPTGNPFNFIPQFSPDGQWIAVLSGIHPIADVYVVRIDGTGLRKLASRNRYEGFTTRWDIYHFHNGDSDLHTWSPDGKWIYYTAQFSEAVDLMRVNLDGKIERLTHSDPSVVFRHPVLRPGGATRSGIRNSHPSVSPDGQWVAFTSTRTGRRQIYVMPSNGGEAYPITNLGPGWGARHAHWRLVSQAPKDDSKTPK